MLEDIFGAFSALIFVIGLLGLFAWSLRRFGFFPGQPKFGKGAKDLEIMESRMIDARSKLVVARWRGKDYLIAFSADGAREIDQRDAPSMPGAGETANDVR